MPFALTLGSVTFLLAVIWGDPLIELMRRLRLGKNIRTEGPESHQKKMGTPAMGGILIIGWVIIITFVTNGVTFLKQDGLALSLLIPLGVMVGYAILGGIDDYMGFRMRPGQGMMARHKIWFQVAIALVGSITLYWANGRHGWMGIPTIPALIDLPFWIYIPIGTFIITGTSNAINITDGLDGLAGTIAATCFVAYGIIASLQGQIFIATFCMVVMGACFAFLWYNAKPAQMFMGDVGSQALGGGLAVVALMTQQWLILPIIAIVPVATTLSTSLQVIYFRRTGGKRLFKMAPLHHHFELSGWSETQIVQRWWLITLLAAMIGVALALI